MHLKLIFVVFVVSVVAAVVAGVGVDGFNGVVTVIVLLLRCFVNDRTYLSHCTSQLRWGVPQGEDSFV